MAMGKRRRGARQPSMWVASTDLPASAGHPFYRRRSHVLDDVGFDAFVEKQCAKFYADRIGRPSLAYWQVLADIIASGIVPVVRLTEVFRQAARSRIVTSAHGINRGVIPDLSPPDGNTTAISGRWPMSTPRPGG